jgi:hypothetical protein
VCVCVCVWGGGGGGGGGGVREKKIILKKCKSKKYYFNDIENG